MCLGCGSTYHRDEPFFNLILTVQPPVTNKEALASATSSVTAGSGSPRPPIPVTNAFALLADGDDEGLQSLPLAPTYKV